MIFEKNIGPKDAIRFYGVLKQNNKVKNSLYLFLA